MNRIRIQWMLLAACAIGVTGVSTATAENFAGQSFLDDYSKLQPMPKSPDGNDFAYLAPGLETRLGHFSGVLVDQPEVFISPDSPYKGAKPEDVAAIAEVIRSTMIAALKERGYVIAEKPAADVLYVRLAVADLKIKKKSRGLLAYTPVGFVVDAGVKALQDFMDKYEVLDLSLQGELQDSVKHDVLVAFYLQRGKSSGAKNPIKFDVMVAVTNELSERFACRLDNGRVTADKRIDCSDPAARKARPLVHVQ